MEIELLGPDHNETEEIHFPTAMLIAMVRFSVPGLNQLILKTKTRRMC